MENNHTKELRQSAVSLKNGVVKAAKEGTLPEFISNNALSIERNEDNEITHILFTYGGPTVYLDFEDSPGIVIASHMSDESQASIPFYIWSDIRDELEVL